MLPRFVYKNIYLSIRFRNVVNHSSQTTNPTSNYQLQHLLQNNPLSIRFISNTPNSNQFTIDYLRKSCGLTSESALKASKFIVLNSTKRPDSVLSLFKTYGFTDSQISKLISMRPKLSLTNPDDCLRPKLEYFSSFGINDHVLWVTYGNSLEVFLPDRKTLLQIRYDVLNATDSSLGILKHGEDIVIFKRSIHGEAAALYVIPFQRLLSGEELEERFETAAGFNFFFVNELEGASREAVNQEIAGRIFSADKGKHHLKIFRCVDGVIVQSEELFQCEVSCCHRFGWQFLR